jgi:hypothetical protein
MADNDQSQRSRQNIAALVFLLVVVIGGALLFLSLSKSAAVLDCMAAHFRNCGEPIDAGQR